MVNSESDSYKQSLNRAVDSLIAITKNFEKELKAEALYYKGFINFKLGKYKEALDDFKESIHFIENEKDNKTKEILNKCKFYNGRTLFKLNRYNEAYQVLSCVINTKEFIDVSKEKNLKANALINKGFVNFKRGEYKEALGDFKESIHFIENEKDTEAKRILIDARFSKGLTLIELNRFYEAINVFDELIDELDKLNREIYSINISKKKSSVSDTVNELEKLILELCPIDISDKNRPDIDIINNINKHYNRKKCEGILKGFDKLISEIESLEFEDINVKETLVDALICKGRIYIKFNMLNAAKECYKKSLEIDVKNIAACNDLALVFVQEGDFNRAKKFIEEISQYGSEYSIGHAYLAEIFLRSGCLKRASEEIMIAHYIETKEPNNSTDLHLAYIHFLDGQISIEVQGDITENKYNKAIESFEKAISYDAGNLRYLLWSIYAKFLCLKFGNNEKSRIDKKSSHEEEKASISCNTQAESNESNDPVKFNSKVESISPKVSNSACSDELFYLITADLEKVLNFYELPAMKRKKPFEEIKRSWPFILSAIFILLFFTIAIILNVASFWNIFEPIIDKSTGFFVRSSFFSKALAILFLAMLCLYFSYRISDPRLRLSKDGNVLKTLIIFQDMQRKFLRFNNQEETKAYALYLLGYFYYKFQDYITAKEKLQESIKLKSSRRIKKASEDLLTNIWNNEIRPPFWNYWFNSPVKTWKRRFLGSLFVLGIFLILFVHLEEPEVLMYNNYKSTISTPNEINVYPYIISYPPNTLSNSHSLNNTFLNSVVPSNNENPPKKSNKTVWNTLTPTVINIYPEIPFDNVFDAICLLILLLILISPSIRIKEALQITLNRGINGSTIGLQTTIEAPPKLNFELSPSHIYDIIRKLDKKQ